MSTIAQETAKRPLGFVPIGLVTTSDWLGMVASIGCAIHCAAMPFVIASLPAWGLSSLAGEAFHKWMALVCFAIAISAFVPGWLKHRRIAPMFLGGMGLALISIAAFGLVGPCCTSCATQIDSAAVGGDTENCCDRCCELCDKTIGVDGQQAVVSVAEVVTAPAISIGERLAPWLTPAGGIFLVTAHLLNRCFGRLCTCCPTLNLETV